MGGSLEYFVKVNLGWENYTLDDNEQTKTWGGQELSPFQTISPIELLRNHQRYIPNWIQKHSTIQATPNPLMRTPLATHFPCTIWILCKSIFTIFCNIANFTANTLQYPSIKIGAYKCHQHTFHGPLFAPVWVSLPLEDHSEKCSFASDDRCTKI